MMDISPNGRGREYTAHLNKGDTFFLPFNQGNNGAGNDDGKSK